VGGAKEWRQGQTLDYNSLGYYNLGPNLLKWQRCFGERAVGRSVGELSDCGPSLLPNATTPAWTVSCGRVRDSLVGVNTETRLTLDAD